MWCLKFLYVALCVVTYVIADCPYTPIIKKIGNCPGSKASSVEFQNISISLAPEDCKIVIIGCLKLLQDMKEIDVKYKAYKDGLPVLTGTKKGCGFKEGKFEVTCPVSKGSKLCPGEGMTLSVPGGAKTLGMAVGKLKVVIDLTSDKGKSCIQGDGELRKK